MEALHRCLLFRLCPCNPSPILMALSVPWALLYLCVVVRHFLLFLFFAISPRFTSWFQASLLDRWFVSVYTLTGELSCKCLCHLKRPPLETENVRRLALPHKLSHSGEIQFTPLYTSPLLWWDAKMCWRQLSFLEAFLLFRSDFQFIFY